MICFARAGKCGARGARGLFVGSDRVSAPLASDNKFARASSPKPLELMDLLPRKHVDKRTDPFKFDVTLRALSLMLSQSYLSLVAQIFRSLPMHLNDRNELSDLIDGVNKVLLAHGDDIGIVSQAMIGK